MQIVFGTIFCENSRTFAEAPDIDTDPTRIPLVLTAMLMVVTTSGCAIFDTWEPPEIPPEKAEKPLQERPRLDPINRNYFVLGTAEQSVIGQPQIVFTREDDTFSDLAREYGLGYDEMLAANPEIDPWLPGDGTPVLLPTQYVLPDVARQGIVLNIASRRLFYFPEVADGEPVKVMTYPIGIGRVGWETPLGETTVVSKALNPHWYVPASVRKEHAEKGDPLPSVVLPGPDNPLGSHVLKLGLPGYLIHGTNQPYGVGMRVSHGCVRLYPENIEHLYSLAGVGEQVRIINEPYLAGMIDGQLYFEAHLPLEDDEQSPETRLQTIFASRDAFDDESIQFAAKAIAAEASGVPVPLLSPGAANVRQDARLVRNTVERDPNAPTLAEVRALLDEPELTD